MPPLLVPDESSEDEEDEDNQEVESKEYVSVFSDILFFCS